MSELSEFERHQADIARKAKDKGYTLFTHLHFSLVNDRTKAVDLDEAETLDDIDEYLDAH
jgi:hypothetical protein